MSTKTKIIKLDKPFRTNESIPPFTIGFHHGEDQIGMFDFSQSPATFKGDVDGSARLFVESVINQFGIATLLAEQNPEGG
tara:strand:+ start:1918 stop:2157 length:240 start_codon:yes stop_codon:yes gene_type:complete